MMKRIQNICYELFVNRYVEKFFHKGLNYIFYILLCTNIQNRCIHASGLNQQKKVSFCGATTKRNKTFSFVTHFALSSLPLPLFFPLYRVCCFRFRRLTNYEWSTFTNKIELVNLLWGDSKIFCKCSVLVLVFFVIESYFTLTPLHINVLQTCPY